MQKDNFENNIRHILGSFDRPAPPESWEHIQKGLKAEKTSFTRPVKLGALVLSGIILLLVGFQIFQTQKANKHSKPLDNYWEGLQKAKQENKPLLVFFTKSCPECEQLSDILKNPNIAKIRNQYVQVELQLDDPSPIDSVLALRSFPELEKRIQMDRETKGCCVRFVDNEQELRTKGQMWQYLLTRVGYPVESQPVLAVFDHQEYSNAFPLYRFSFEYSSEEELTKAIGEFLELQYNIVGQNFFQAASLFTKQCATCHNLNMKDRLTGPSLGGVTERWKQYPREDLYGFIRNSQQMIADGHPEALEQWDNWSPVLMPNFPDLSDRELEQLLNFVEWRYRQN